MSRNKDGTKMNKKHFRGDIEFNELTYRECKNSGYLCEGTVTFDSGKQIEFQTAQSPEHGSRKNFREDINEAVKKSRRSKLPPRHQQYNNKNTKPGGGKIVDKRKTQSQNRSRPQGESTDGENQLKSPDESIGEGEGFSHSL